MEEDQGTKDDKISILVVEDDEMIANLLCESVAKIGFDMPKVCLDGMEAWEALQEEKVDLILMDWNIPELSGMALFNRLRQDQYYRSIPICVISGYLQTKDFSLLDEYPLTGKLPKPYKQMKLQETINDLLAETEIEIELASDGILKVFEDDGAFQDAIKVAHWLKQAGVQHSALTTDELIALERPDRFQVFS